MPCHAICRQRACVCVWGGGTCPPNGPGLLAGLWEPTSSSCSISTGKRNGPPRMEIASASESASLHAQGGARETAPSTGRFTERVLTAPNTEPGPVTSYHGKRPTVPYMIMLLHYELRLAAAASPGGRLVSVELAVHGSRYGRKTRASPSSPAAQRPQRPHWQPEYPAYCFAGG